MKFLLGAIHGKLVAVLNQIRQDVEMIIRFEKYVLMRRGVIGVRLLPPPVS